MPGVIGKIKSEFGLITPTLCEVATQYSPNSVLINMIGQATHMYAEGFVAADLSGCLMDRIT